MSTKKTELFIIYITLLIWIMNYFFVAGILDKGNLNYSYLIHTPLDDLITFSSFWNVFYISWFFVLGVIFPIFYLYSTQSNVEDFRRVCITFFITYAIAYTIYFIMPVNSYIINHGNYQDECLFFCSTDQTLRGIVPRWNAFPSLHIATSWLILRTVHQLAEQYSHKHLIFGITLLWFCGLLCSTVKLRYHYLLDVVGGIFLAECMFQFVYQRLGFVFLKKIASFSSQKIIYTELCILAAVTLFTASMGLAAFYL